jgi:hypothetical protein
MTKTLAALPILCALAIQAQAGDAPSLVSVRIAAPVTLDGAAEAAWEAAPVLKLVLDKSPYKPDVYPGVASSEITVRSAYDAENVYFLVQYKDPTRSLARFPWVKQDDGTWKQARKADSTGSENTFYEDKFAIIWDTKAGVPGDEKPKGFAKLGCAAVCHMSVNGKVGGVADTAPGRKYTKTGETIDLWVWRGLQASAIGQFEDMFINDNNPADPETWGRHPDANSGGGYIDNINEAKNGPAFMSAKPEADKPWIADDQKAPFADTFKAGDSVPSVIARPHTGSRADLTSASRWADGAWTIEFKRKLVTTGEKANVEDVQFSDLTKAYSFGVAIFDGSQINHLYHGGSPKLTFKP